MNHDSPTGRIGHTQPNLQNIPIRTERGRRIREAFFGKVPKMGLDSGTRRGYSADMDTQEETWAKIPDLNGYEVSTAARVRSWITLRGQAVPMVYSGTTLKGGTIYTLSGTTYTIDELMRWTFGEEFEYEESHDDPGEAIRELSQYEINEIVLAEGHKPAYEVAAEFRIYSSRVRLIWDGDE